MSFGLHYSDTLLGRVFSQAATPLGLAIPIYTATAIAGGMPIWNPPGSNRNVELISVDIDYTGTSAAALSAIGLMAGQLNSIATASGCSAFAATTPANGLLLGGNASKVMSSNAGTVTVTAGVATAPVGGVPGAGWVRPLASINVETTSATPHGTLICTYVFNGTIIIPPGVLVYLAGSLASVGLYASGIVWKEVPIVASQG